MKKIPDIIQILPLNIITRMKIERRYILLAKKINRILGRKKDTDCSYYPLVRNNRFYGDEVLLRKYSKEKDFLYAIIEHGLYFGNNTAKVGNLSEWELGCILTLGDYRKELINREYPDFYCETIGPLIHYADIDIDYMNTLKDKICRDKRTLLFFPVHGNENFAPIYDARVTLNKILSIADEKNCYNIIICVYYENINMYGKICDEMKNDRITITTCGNRYDEKFLCKQKALISLADITMSNSLGTHIGYCIYMNKPHILLPQNFSYEGNEKEIKREFGKANRSENWEKDYKKEERLFQEIFSIKYEKITDEQLRICEYYWGINKVRTKEEIKDIYDKCKKYAITYQRR